MYIQCPDCQAVFNATQVQLKARDGLVRCGLCGAAFNARDRGVKAPPAAAPEKPPHAPRVKRVQPLFAERRGKIAVGDIAPLLAKRRSRAHPVLWFMGSVLLLTLLAGQWVFFYPDRLTPFPALRPWVLVFCSYAGCEIRPRQDVARIELLQSSIAPHPQFENALRLRASLVNRADFPQPYPQMEVSLSDNAGNVIARRRFAPQQYLEKPPSGVEPLEPHVALAALVDVTNPDGKAVGYEIKLVASNP